jgi:hypothetical protein
MSELNMMFGDDSDDETVQSDVHRSHEPLTEIRLMPGIGGSRGLFATNQLDAGFLVLSEVSEFVRG